MKATRYYVSRKNPLTWLSAAMTLAAAVLLILAASKNGDLTTTNLWFQTVLPVWVCLGFSFIVLVRGQSELYRLTKPVFWGGVYFGQVALDWYLRLQQDPSAIDNLRGGYHLFASLRYVLVCWLLYLVLYIFARLILTGKFKRTLFLPLFAAIPAAILTYDFCQEAAGAPASVWYAKLANLLMVGALLVVSLAMRVFKDNKYHPTWGDRSDGRLVRSITGMNLLVGYFMPDRVGASNNIQDTVEITAVERYIHKKRQEGYEGFGLMHVFLASYVRCVAKYPGLNRFFSGQRVFQRDDDVAFTMTLKKDMATDGEETTIKLHLNVRDTAVDVYHKLNALITEVKSSDEASSFDAVAGLLACIPGLLLKFTVWCLKVADYFGKLPKFLLELSPFHGSVIFTSMGSLGIPPIVHHLYDFGNLPLFLAFGRKYRKTELDANGEPVTRRYVDIVLNTDERTVDGFYYAAVLKYFHKITRNPAQLDNPPEEVVRDQD